MNIPKEKIDVGFTFIAYSRRTFTVKSINKHGVWTERDDGDKGFFTWRDLKTLGVAS